MEQRRSTDPLIIEMHGDLSAMKVHLHEILGNGQPGKLDRLSTRIFRLEVALLLVVGAALGPRLIETILAVLKP